MDTANMPKALAAKMAKTMLAVDRIRKNGRNDFHGYKYATEDAIAEAVREQLANNNVAFFPTVIRDSLERFTVASDKGKENVVQRLWMAITWVDADSGESWTAEFPGDGQDNADKGLYKAMTGAIKYALLKTFLLPTGDDPEQMNDVERQAQDASAGRGGRGQDRRQGGQGGAGQPKQNQAPAGGAGQPQPNQQPQGGAQTAGGKVFPDRVERLVKKAAGAGLKETEMLSWVSLKIRPVHALGELTFREFPTLENQVDDYIARKAEAAAGKAAQGGQDTTQAS